MQCSLKLTLVSYACNLEAKAGLVRTEFKARLIYIVTLSPKRHSFLFRCHLGISIFMSETIQAVALCHNVVIIFIQLDGFSFF